MKRPGLRAPGGAGVSFRRRAGERPRLSLRANQTHRRRRGRGRALPLALVCLQLFVVHLTPACGYQRRPHTATATPPADGATGAASWGAEVGGLVRFPSPEVAFIAGPQLEVGHPSNPAPWFDQNGVAKGREHGAAFPAAPPGVTPWAGTLTVTRGSAAVLGLGTRFKADLTAPPSEYNFLIADEAGVPRFYYVAAILDDTHLQLTAPYRNGSGSARTYGAVTAADLDAYVNLNYYDQALVQYVNYYRTGDAAFQGYARKISDSWWKAPQINEGKTPAEDSFAPRNSSLAGLMLRALDGRPEMWPWITAYVRAQFQTWVGTPLGWYRPMKDEMIAGREPEPNGKTFPHGLYSGVRDPGYMLLYAANLARVHPDPGIREEFKAKALDAAVNYYARFQRVVPPADGGFYFELPDLTGLTTQPFQEGLLGEGLIAVHRLTGDERLKPVITRLAEHLYLKTYNPRGWRALYYFVGGKLGAIDCAAGCGMASQPFPPADNSQIAEARQLAGTMVHTFGYAYLLTGDAKFKTWGDEIFDATYSGKDGRRGLAAFRAKEYDEAYRSAGRYLAWRLAHGGAVNSSPAPAPPAPARAEAAGGSAPADLIASALAEALRLSSGAPSEAQLQALLGQIEGARKAFADEQERFTAPAEVIAELKGAAEHARNALLIVKSSGGPGEEAKVRVGWAAARLKRAGERIKPRAGK